MLSAPVAVVVVIVAVVLISCGSYSCSSSSYSPMLSAPVAVVVVIVVSSVPSYVRLLLLRVIAAEIASFRQIRRPMLLAPVAHAKRAHTHHISSEHLRAAILLHYYYYN